MRNSQCSTSFHTRLHLVPSCHEAAAGKRSKARSKSRRRSTRSVGATSVHLGRASALTVEEAEFLKALTECNKAGVFGRALIVCRDAESERLRSDGVQWRQSKEDMRPTQLSYLDMDP